MSSEPTYYLYLLLCDQTIIYTGIAIDPLKRLEQHLSGKPQGAKFTQRFKNLKLVYQIKVGSRSQAQSLEIKVKKLKKIQKEKLIEEQLSLNQLQKILR